MSTINPIKYIHYERRVWHDGDYISFTEGQSAGYKWRYVRPEIATALLVGIRSGTFDLLERWEEADNGEVLQG
jgi:hypothetical protein